MRRRLAEGSSYAPMAGRGCAPTAASAATTLRAGAARPLWLLTSPALDQQPARAREDNAALALRLLGQQRAPGLVRRRPRRTRCRGRVLPRPAAAAVARPEHDPAGLRGVRADALAGPPAGPAGHRAAAGRRAGGGVDPGARPDLPPRRRPRARRRDPGRRDPAPAHRRARAAPAAPASRAVADAVAARTGRDPRRGASTCWHDPTPSPPTPGWPSSAAGSSSSRTRYDHR